MTQPYPNCSICRGGRELTEGLNGVKYVCPVCFYKTELLPMLSCYVCNQPVREAFPYESGQEAILCQKCDQEDAPNTPALEGLDDDLPQLLPEPTEAERAHWYREDAVARNFSDGRAQ